MIHKEQERNVHSHTFPDCPESLLLCFDRNGGVAWDKVGVGLVKALNEVLLASAKKGKALELTILLPAARTTIPELGGRKGAATVGLAAVAVDVIV